MTAAKKATARAATAPEDDTADVDQVDPDQVDAEQTDTETDETATQAQVGDIVRLNDPEDTSQPDRYALVVGEQLIADLPGARAYQLPVYPAS